MRRGQVSYTILEDYILLWAIGICGGTLSLIGYTMINFEMGSYHGITLVTASNKCTGEVRVTKPL